MPERGKWGAHSDREPEGTWQLFLTSGFSPEALSICLLQKGTGLENEPAPVETSVCLGQLQPYQWTRLDALTSRPPLFSPHPWPLTFLGSMSPESCWSSHWWWWRCWFSRKAKDIIQILRLHRHPVGSQSRRQVFRNRNHEAKSSYSSMMDWGCRMLVPPQLTPRQVSWDFRGLHLFFLIFLIDFRERHCFLFPYLCIHWLIFVCALTRDLTCNLGVSGPCSNQLSYPARAEVSILMKESRREKKPKLKP